MQFRAREIKVEGRRVPFMILYKVGAVRKTECNSVGTSAVLACLVWPVLPGFEQNKF